MAIFRYADYYALYSFLQRIDAQYYIKVGSEPKVRAMLNEAKLFVAGFDNRVSHLNDADIKHCRESSRWDPKQNLLETMPQDQAEISMPSLTAWRTIPI